MNGQKQSTGDRDYMTSMISVLYRSDSTHIILKSSLNIIRRNKQSFRENYYFISCLPVGYREISVKIFFDLTLVAPVKILIFTFLLPRLIARASQPDGNMTSFTLNFSRLT